MGLNWMFRAMWTGLGWPRYVVLAQWIVSQRRRERWQHRVVFRFGAVFPPSHQFLAATFRVRGRSAFLRRV